MTVVLGTSARDIRVAAEALEGGALVAFPTETVYDLGARADQPEAVAKIFAAKGRPADHPLIVHLPGPGDLDRWAREVPETARRLAERFWPGPLTLILRRAPGVSDTVTGGQDTVGLRVPGHPVALALLEAVGLPLAAPSANRYGRVSPTTAAHVLDELGDSVQYVIDGGPCQVGLESTIVDLSGGPARILRPGAISREALAEVLGEMPQAAGTDVPRVPGSLEAHYAPGIPLRLVDASEIERELEARSRTEGLVAVLARRPAPAAHAGVRWLGMPDDPKLYGRRLYATLREAEDSGCNSILVEGPPSSSAWDAVRDRLMRAETGTRGADA